MPLVNFAQRYVIDLNDARDIVQVTFIKIWENRETLPSNLKINPYLYKSVKNQCLDHIRHLKIKDQYWLTVFSQLEHTYPKIDHVDDGYKNLVYKDFKKEVREAIASLPEECRRIFTLSRFNAMKYSEIAKFLDISVKTVETQVSIALQKLRVSLKYYLPVLVILLSILMG